MWKVCYRKTSLHTFHLTILTMILTGAIGCSNSAPVDEKVRIETADTELYADIRGNDRDAPILLYLHGGPANPFGI